MKKLTALILAAALLAPAAASAAGCLVWKRGPGGMRCVVHIGSTTTTTSSTRGTFINR